MVVGSPFSFGGDVAGLVRPDEVLVDGNGVLERSGEGVFGSQTVEDGDNLHFRQVGDGDGFGQGTGIGVESAAVEVDERAVGDHSGEWGDEADGNAGDGAPLYAGRIDPAGGFACASLPCVGPGAALLQRLRAEGIRCGSGHELLRLGTEALRHGDDAGDVRSAIGRDVARVLVGSLGPSGALLGGEGEGEEEQAEGSQNFRTDLHTTSIRHCLG